MHILITAASSARAYQLKAQLSNHEVLLGDYHDLPEVMVKAGQLLQLPSPQSPSYAHQMLTLCLDMQIAEVHILSAEEATLLQESELLFNEYGVELITYSYDL